MLSLLVSEKGGFVEARFETKLPNDDLGHEPVDALGLASATSALELAARGRRLVTSPLRSCVSTVIQFQPGSRPHDGSTASGHR